MKYDTLIIGSGAGGSAAAYQLAQGGAHVLLLEKGAALPRDGSTLDPRRVLRDGAFLSDEPWLDRSGEVVVPEEHFNLGGKTKWYGAALLRMSPHEFEADQRHQCPAWPITYDELSPYYEQAEALLGVRVFPPEPDLQRLVADLRRMDLRWQRLPMPLGLAPDILSDIREARHYDAFASVRGMKSDAERNFLDRVRHGSSLEVLTGKEVVALLPAAESRLRIAGVRCADGSQYEARQVLLAAGTLHSPRLLQRYLAATELTRSLPAAAHVGRYYKSHVLTAMLVLSPRLVKDVLCKTLLMLHESFPHSSVQTLGGNLAEELIRLKAPRLLPGVLKRPLARRAYGLFLQTEDGSNRDNRVMDAPAGGKPVLDYDIARLSPAQVEHTNLVRALRLQLLRLGRLPLVQSVPLSGTAHACGTLVTGVDARTSVTNSEGRVHGIDNLYIVDGSVLPRSSRVNPALTIYAWGLRVAARLNRGDTHATRATRADSIRA
ncbi:MAG: GMC family oxidoreductase [Betaproteobacteria bacterium]|nr:GMC family oxidoreductase [Betaproteobacteria bacterium]